MPLLVQHASNWATSGSTVTVTLGAGTTAGNCLPVCAGSDGSSVRTVSSVALGTTGDTFTPAKGESNTAGSADLDCEAWTDAGCTGSQTSVKVTFSGTVTAAAAIAMEWSGLPASGAVDTAATAGANGNAATTFSSGATGTLSEASAAVIGACWGTSFEAPSLAGPSSPWTNFTGVTAGSDAELLVGYQVVSSSSSLTYSGTGTEFGFDWGAVIVPLKAATIVDGADTGSGAESGTITATLSGSDAGSGADTAAIGISGTETGSGADTASPPAATVTGADTGTGTEGTPSVTLTGGDTGSGADTATAVAGASGSDTGTGAESSTITATVDGTDTGSGAESSPITATAPTATDTGSGADTAEVVILGADTGSAAESASQSPAPPPKLVLWRATDRLSKTGGTMT